MSDSDLDVIFRAPIGARGSSDALINHPVDTIVRVLGPDRKRRKTESAQPSATPAVFILMSGAGSNQRLDDHGRALSAQHVVPELSVGSACQVIEVPTLPCAGLQLHEHSDGFELVDVGICSAPCPAHLRPPAPQSREDALVTPGVAS